MTGSSGLTAILLASFGDDAFSSFASLLSQLLRMSPILALLPQIEVLYSSMHVLRTFQDLRFEGVLLVHQLASTLDLLSFIFLQNSVVQAF